MLVDETLIVLLRKSENYNDIQNVYGVELDGSVVWQIEQIVRLFSPFSNIYIEAGELYAVNFSGMAYCLEPKTGRVIRKVFLK